MICFFRDLTTEQAALAGGKGSALARLFQAGYPVPNGVLTAAFEGAQGSSPAQDSPVPTADTLKPAAWEQVRAALSKLRAGRGDASFAVRSSALSEDSAQASFAGAFETVLDVRDDDGIRRAIEAVRRSRHAGRVEAYSRAQGLTTAHEVAVIVQELAPADLSGVLFTADPVTGSRAAMVGNVVRGLGEKLVSGEATAPSFTRLGVAATLDTRKARPSVNTCHVGVGLQSHPQKTVGAGHDAARRCLRLRGAFGLQTNARRHGRRKDQPRRRRAPGRCAPHLLRWRGWDSPDG
jgi:hypothetical protein